VILTDISLKGDRSFHRTVRGNIISLAALALTLTMFEAAYGYVMTAKQIVDMMASRFSKIETLVITQSTHIIEPRTQEVRMVLEEKLWIKVPRFYKSKLIEKSEDHDRIDASTTLTPLRPGNHVANEIAADRSFTDSTFRSILMADRGDRTLTLLSQIGIDLKSVGLTRLDGIITYCIGDKDPKSPKILIDKERFLPLFLSYFPAGESGPRLTVVRFNDYRELPTGWYPFQIDYSMGTERMERCFVLDLQVNAPVDVSIFEANKR